MFLLVILWKVLCSCFVLNSWGFFCVVGGKVLSCSGLVFFVLVVDVCWVCVVRRWCSLLGLV